MKLDRAELDAMFGGNIPIVVMKVLFPEKSEPLTTDEVRTILRALTASNSGEVVAYMYTHDGMIHDDEHPALLSVKRWSKCEEPWNETPLYLAPRSPEASPAVTDEPEFQVAPDNGTVNEVLAYVLDCAQSWVPEARIIGNARAGDITRALTAALRQHGKEPSDAR